MILLPQSLCGRRFCLRIERVACNVRVFLCAEERTIELDQQHKTRLAQRREDPELPTQSEVSLA